MVKRFFTSLNRLEWIKIIIGVAFIIQVLISIKLWYSLERLYPVVPMFGINSFWMDANMQMVTLWLLLLASLGLIVIRNVKVSSLLFLAVLTLFFIQDVSRIQAWSYQYYMMAVVLAIYGFNKNEKAAILALQLVLVFTYFWSGLQKFNIYFAEMVYPWLMEAHPILEGLIDKIDFAYVIAIFEALLGIGLFFKGTRTITLWLAVIFHVLIVLMLIGLDWNVVVYPWNAAMIGFLIVLFYDFKHFKMPSNVRLANVFKNKTPIANLGTYLIILFFGIMPLFNFFNLWNDGLSLKMYSGVSSEGVFYFHAKDFECLPDKLLDDLDIGENKNEMLINLDDWAFEELTVPAFSSDNAYKKAALKFCDCVQYKDETGVEIHTSPRFEKKDIIRRISCKEIYLAF